MLSVELSTSVLLLDSLFGLLFGWFEAGTRISLDHFTLYILIRTSLAGKCIHIIYDGEGVN